MRALLSLRLLALISVCVGLGRTENHWAQGLMALCVLAWTALILWDQPRS